MGAPKQKWTAEEEAALRAGVCKHGPGKWRGILKDPEFSGVLRMRSNVDLKDKWRNMSVTANGWGSRDRGRLSLKTNQIVTKHDDTALIPAPTEDLKDYDMMDAKPLAAVEVLPETLPTTATKKSFQKLENLILEAIITMKEPAGSNKRAITMYLEDQYDSPPNFKRMLSIKLKTMVANGKLLKVKRKYRITPNSGYAKQKVHETQKEPICLERKDVKPLEKSQIDDELMKISNMDAQEAAAAAARAVAEAEVAIAEAEEAAREAEAAEADAEATQLFAEAAIMTLRNRSMGKLMIPA